MVFKKLIESQLVQYTFDVIDKSKVHQDEITQKQNSKSTQ